MIPCPKRLSVPALRLAVGLVRSCAWLACSGPGFVALFWRECWSGQVLLDTSSVGHHDVAEALGHRPTSVYTYAYMYLFIFSFKSFAVQPDRAVGIFVRCAEIALWSQLRWECAHLMRLLASAADCTSLCSYYWVDCRLRMPALLVFFVRRKRSLGRGLVVVLAYVLSLGVCVCVMLDWLSCQWWGAGGGGGRHVLL